MGRLRWNIMTARQRDHIDEVLADKERIKAAVTRAVREAILRHKQAGNPIVGRVEGKMVWLKPEEINVSPNSAGD